MNKFYALITMVFFALTMNAQTEQRALIDSKPWDNWYFGVNGGASVKTTHNSWLNNLNGNAGVRVGRWFTPCFGLVLDDNVYFNDRPNLTNAGTIVKVNQMNLGATINFMNWFGGYKGEPRAFEIIGVPALGWAHAFGNEEKRATNLNAMMAKVAVDFAVNLGKEKALQLYLEPALNYSVYSNGAERMSMDLNSSAFQLNLGLVYKFKNTNGTHNFKYAEPVIITDNSQTDALNRRIAALEEENARLKNQKPVANNVTIVNTLLAPVVIFRQGSAVVDDNQYAEIERVAEFMKSNVSASVELKGYASVEGPAELNQKLSEDRATAVADILVKKYGIEADRLSVSSFGATDQQSSEQAFNRVVTFSEVKK